MRVVLIALGWLMATGSSMAQIESYAALERIWDAEISPDGNHLATGCSPRNALEICIYDLSGATPARVIPAPDGGRITGFFWPSPDYLVYWVSSYQTIHVSDGLQHLDVERALSFSLETGSTSILLAEIGNVTGLRDISSVMVNHDDRVAMELTLLQSAQTSARSRLSRGGGFATAVYEVSLETGELLEIRQRATDSTIGYRLDMAGDPVLDIRLDADSGDYSINRVEGRRRQPIFEGNYGARRPSVFGLTDDGQAVAIRLPDGNLHRLNIATGEMTPYQANGVDITTEALIIDRYAGEVVGVRYTADMPVQVFMDEELAGLHAELKTILTETTVLIAAWTPDRMKMVVIGMDPGQPENYYLLDLATGGLGLLDTAASFADGQGAGERIAFDYEASDGLEIRAYLTLPPGHDDNSATPPLVVMPHGGPQARDDGRYDWWAAYYASLGYAVLQPNFRGSAGYGIEFTQAGHGEFGGRMIQDSIDGARHLQAEGLVRDGEYCVVGASYGGYAALMAGLMDPANVGCVVSFAGVTNPFSFLVNRSEFPILTQYWEEYIGDRFGDPVLRDSITPAARAAELGMPILMIHGDEDTTVPVDQMRLMRNGLAQNQDVGFVFLEGEDHYLGSVAARTRLLQESGDFLQQHLPVE
jgi:dienelactone hydrolase